MADDARRFAVFQPVGSGVDAHIFVIQRTTIARAARSSERPYRSGD
jgi:hypothetical protein